MSSPERRQRNEWRALLKARISREEVQAAQAEIAAKIQYNPEKWEAFLDFIEQDFYEMVVPKFDPDLAPFDALPLEMREKYVEIYGDEKPATPDVLRFQCAELAGGTENMARLLSQYDLEIKRGQQEAFAFFDMFSQGRNLGKLPKPDYVIAFLHVVMKRGDDFLGWLARAD